VSPVARFKCEGCRIEINTKKAEKVSRLKGCMSEEQLYSCPKCGRLHFYSGIGAYGAGEEVNSQERLYLAKRGRKREVVMLPSRRLATTVIFSLPEDRR